MKLAEEWAPEFCFGGDIQPDITTIIRRIQADASGQWVLPHASVAEFNQLRDQLANVLDLLLLAKCPDCNGSGSYAQETRDGGCDQVECRWCSDRASALIKQHESQQVATKGEVAF